MLSVLLLSLMAVLISGAPTTQQAKCPHLKQITNSIKQWMNQTKGLISVSKEFVEDLKLPHEHHVKCEVQTLCKAHMILRNQTEKAIISMRLEGLSRTLSVYSRHHGCAGSATLNPDQIDLKGFVMEVANCTQKLHNKCH